MAFAWFRSKVLQRCARVRFGRSSLGPYAAGTDIEDRKQAEQARTVRGETRMPSLRASPAAIRVSPQVGFSRTISTIRSLRSLGSFGRHPRDFHRHKSWKARGANGSESPVSPPRAHRARETSPTKTAARTSRNPSAVEACRSALDRTSTVS